VKVISIPQSSDEVGLKGNVFLRSEDIKAFSAFEAKDGSVIITIECRDGQTYDTTWPSNDQAGAANFSRDLQRAMAESY
jgi:hypothetical protein